MKWMVGVLLWLGMTLAACAQPAGDPAPLQYRDRAEEARFHALTAELRCVQCQNQSLADSNAQIAHDLRREVLKLMHEGRSDAQIKQFLVERYGEFVLYRPAMEPGTALLWFGPGLLLLAGAVVLVMQVRKRARGLPAAAADEHAQEDREW
ncbi:cytochrome c-type biogenesis protein [Stenotrophomonas sp. Iso1]|uniref:cytochrome c-type biogenesis protein n=1 Tax=Stenotrophomonas sp. Iso1 TaxID=2977283 RepID=UPI0022B7D0A4|nr:cytochrome c-type biogenesis protein [Stenotrophomonas sp. Iso1]